MKTIRFFFLGILLMAALSMISCRKDPSEPTGKVFNAESGGDNTLDSLTISIIANPNDGGRVYGGGTYQKGQECTVIASPNDGYTFINWRENDSIVAEDKLFRFTVVSNRTLVANFTQQEPQNHTISVSANPSDGGTITGGGTYQDGETCMVTAMANEGYIFSNWTENGIQVSTSVTYSFIVDTDRSLVANFSVSPGLYTITAVPSPMYGGVINGSGTYIQGNTCMLTAISNEGYTFTHWTENGNQVSDEIRYSFTVTGNRTLVAHFTTNPQSFTVSVSANPSNGGIVTGNGTYQQGQQCTVTATANTGYTFANWTENGSAVSTQANYTFTVNNNCSLVAQFSANPQAPMGAINGTFTTNFSGYKVWFSKGNLQYIGSASTPYWKFADHQWDYLGTTTGQNSTNQNVDRDLFGWGTSGWNNGNTYYRPWDTDNSNANSYGPLGLYNLTDSYANADWGVYNVISNGDNQAGCWRTLTKDEWSHVLFSRSASTVNGTANARFVKAMVNNVKGIILFPDNYTQPIGIAQPIGINTVGTYWEENNYNMYDFVLMENNGAVFLPTAGCRHEISVLHSGNEGKYWSSSYSGSGGAYYLGIGETSLSSQSQSVRWSGQSVRLVKDY